MRRSIDFYAWVLVLGTASFGAWLMMVCWLFVLTRPLETWAQQQFRAGFAVTLLGIVFAALSAQVVIYGTALLLTIINRHLSGEG